MRQVLRSICAGALVLFGTSTISAAQTAGFYDGKQVTIIVGNPAGGGFDAYARLVARHMHRHIPGNPKIIVQNMPGAGSVKAAQYLANAAPKDGLTFGLLVPGAIFDPLLERSSRLRYAPTDFEYIGSADSGTRICLTSRKSGIQTLQDARKTKVVVASTAPQSSATDYALFMNALAGTKFEIVMGYKGPANLLLAMERGEAQGVCALDAGTVNAIRPDWLKNREVNVLVQAGLKPSPSIDAPSIFEFIKGDNRAVAELIVSQQEFSRPFVAPAGIPAAQLETLRTAFMQTMRDDKLIAEARKMGIGVNAKSGEEIAAIVKRLYASPPELIDRVRAILRP